MASSSKLKNVEAINRMLRGEHKTQTRKVFGYTNVEKNRERAAIRKPGDVWTETDSNGNTYIWEQHEGFKSKRSPNSDMFMEVRHDLRQFKNCPKETCTCVNPSHLDKKFRITHGMCFDCVTEEETRMKISGEFDAYAAERVYENVKAFFKDRDAELDEMKRLLKDDLHIVTSEHGDIETWQTDDPDATMASIESKYLEYKEAMLSYYNPNKSE